MTRIDFYLVQSPGESAARRVACRLANKAWRAGNQVFIHTRNEDETQAMDELLWTFSPGSFVPHGTGESDPAAPVVIDAGPAPEDHTAVLISLRDEVPEGFSRFQRLAEIVAADEVARNGARERYRFYRDRGYPLEKHDVVAG
ncbi:MAG: DNA polymerase III subunit chi [Gammaproteobacteria bacterium]|nr:DNA polymerase III subunit chi [Gammaproteobacteria bacterium]